MPVEEVLVVGQRVVVAQLCDGLVRVAVPEPAQPGVRQPLERAPHYLVLDAAHVYAHPAVERLGPHDHERLGRQRRQGPAVQPAVQLLRLRRRGRWWLPGARGPDLLLTVRLRGGRGRSRGPSHGRADRWQPRAASAAVGFESGARIAFRGHQPDTGPSSTVNLPPPIRLRNKTQTVVVST